MTLKQEPYLNPLDRLQADAVSAAASPSEWLDAHRVDVLIVWKEKGITTIAALLGLSTSTLRGWAKRRNLGDGIIKRRSSKKGPGKDRPGPGNSPAEKAAGPAAPVSSSPRLDQSPAKDPSPHHATSATAFWRGQAEAYKHALELVVGALPGRQGKEEA